MLAEAIKDNEEFKLKHAVATIEAEELRVRQIKEQAEATREAEELKLGQIQEQAAADAIKAAETDKEKFKNKEI